MEYLKPFQLIKNIRTYVNQDSDGVEEVLYDASNRFMLYMKHRVRCHDQQIVVGDN